MARSKQEDLLLEERIEKIRKRNEEIKRRHLEVEADKQNAAKLNALVQITSPAEDWPIGGRSPPHSHGIIRGRHLEQDRLQQNNSNSNSSAKCYTFGEQEGSLPDASYKFLADVEQDSDRSHSQQRSQWRGKTSRRSRGAFTRGRGRQRLHQYGGGSDVPQPEYEAWRAERNRIDRDRISRQKTAEGRWRREWDNEKITQEEEDVRPTTRMSRGGGFDRSDSDCSSYHDYRAHTTQNCVRSGENALSGPFQVSERSGGGHGVSRGNRGNVHTWRHNQPQTQPIHDDKEKSTVVSHSERNVVTVGESMKICVRNSSPAPPVRRVRVNIPVVAGTGRVGPRQRLRISYSSQSEDEAPFRRIAVQSNRASSNDEVPPDSNSTHSTASSAVSKPPLPPTGMKLNPKTKKLHFKKPEQDTKLRKQRVKKEIDSTELSKCMSTKEGEVTMVKVEDCQKDIESGGDDSWEDVTASGNESACEELSPCSNTDSTLDIKTTELKCGMLHTLDVKSEFLQNTELKLGLPYKTEVESGMLLNTEVKVEMPHADRNNPNIESNYSIEVSQIITDGKVPETVVSERSTECNEHKDITEIYFDKSHSNMLVETKKGNVNQTKELEEKENIKSKEKMLEGGTKIELKNGCRQDEAVGEAEVIQTTESETLSDGAAENCMLDEKQKLV
ncbi:uncharacterized protein LOC110834558 [Zootermopsis nevadensis]|uniref:Coiled-coil domain-containing protein 9 n=1 Tax=Zootermopsis nevadensis TaxID=136037 RepID=A0A067QVU8_ZOONE|nr:uncharacterized protein LOC110834558 [Zootermopsis nevadensis]XP_021929535.1 uncharacterized protein LOC110834558 [Zootermopsis nevadensis]KDR14365.1 hypothetical protein L798_10399 [Zootermopsis nevadensis]